MADRGKTIMCSVLFLDIAEYSKKSVSGQISLKERFNAYLSVAIRDVPIDDRIILDTGDGAALSFLGDVGDALQVALSMRESLREGLDMEPPLLLRIGVNLGPVRLIRDLNGQPNIVGDGINVAQRVMDFADPGQILVSRPYYDAVSRLSPEYAGMFHYQGSRTDKHVREHEIYAIGYPGEFTSTLTLSGDAGRSRGELSGLSKQLGKSWRSAIAAFRKASPLTRIAYAGAALVPIIVVMALVSEMWRSAPSPAPQKQEAGQASLLAPQAAPIVPASAVIAAVPVTAQSAPTIVSGENAETGEKIKASKKTAKEKALKKKTSEKKVPEKKEQGKKVPEKTGVAAGQTALMVVCTEGSSVYVDGQPKGKIGKSPMLLRVDPGKHLVMLMSASRVYSMDMNFGAGKTIRVNPDFCH